MKIIFLLCLISFFCIDVPAQLGCTDIQAQNFNPNAIQNDGSCVYAASSYTPQLINNLSSVLEENSGIIFSDNVLYNINDGGNQTNILELNLQGDITRTIQVNTAQNTDWEAITQNTNDIFIGDFGNNSGNRSDLKIYRVSKNELASSDTVNAVNQVFFYSDQTNFNNVTNSHNFDCEAFIYYQDSLHLFTKGWENLYTKHYVIPILFGDTSAAILRDSMFVDGLITDATIDSVSGNLLLLGYKNNGSNFYTSFVYLLFDYSNTSFFAGNKRRIEIGNMFNLSQTEGISFQNEFSGFISSEKISSSLITIEPKIFSFDFSSFLENNSRINELSLNENSVYPNPSQDRVTLPFNYKTIDILDAQGIQLIRIETESWSNTLDLSELPISKGNIYYIHCTDLKKTAKFIYK
jgi:hypothetical protein